MKKQSFTDSKQCMAFLAARYRIPRPTLEMVRAVMIQDAVVDGNSMAYNRIYTAVALMLHDHLKFGRKRIVAALHCFDDICGRVMDDTTSWHDIMKELDDKTGLIIRMNEDDKLLCEYVASDEEDA
jgi:hypothetical protein